MEDVEVVGDHVAQPAREAALAEVDLLAVAGRERLVELADQLQSRAADVEAVPDAGRDPRVQPRRGARDPRVGLVDREPRRRLGRRVLPVGDREDRAVVRERAGGRHEPVAVGRGAQALEPRGRHDGVGVDDHHVGRRGVAERRVHVRDEAEVRLAPHVLDAIEPAGERLDLAVRRGVVGDHDPRPRRRVGDDAAQALLEQLARAVDGHDDDRVAALHPQSSSAMCGAERSKMT